MTARRVRHAHRSTALRRGVLALASALVLVGSTSSALAQGEGRSGAPQMSNEMRAEYLFRTGEKKFDAGQYAEACADFAQSLRLGPKLGTLLNLALCHETVGKPATAWSEWNHAAAWAAQNGQKDRHDFALQHAIALETKLPRVLLQIPSTQAIATVEVDGEPLPEPRWYLPVYLDPGEHTVALTAPGKARGTTRFRVINSPTEQLVSIPALVDDVPAPPSRADVVADPDAAKRTVGIVTLATGGAITAVGLGFGLLAMSARSDAADQCIGNRCTVAGADAYETAQSRATVATVMTIVGLGTVGIGTWLVLSSRSPSSAPPVTPSSPSSAPPRATGPAVRAAARARADGGFELAVGGAF